MINAFKKLTSPRSDNNLAAQAAKEKASGVHAMSSTLQRRFAHGVHYNMKLLLRGDRSTGKTALFNRLQGGKFIEEYHATEEIQVEAIQWSHKATDDIVKVEVWDVVDKGKKRIKLEGLKINADDGKSGPNSIEASLDAEFVDVYKGAHGVIFLFDITKQWTFDYIKREVPKVPRNIPILILGNFADQSHHRCITRDQVLGYVEELGNEVNARYAEASMRNGFGLKYLHKFLSLPYLTLQRESLIRQLDMNTHEIEATKQELDLYFDSSECDYEKFADGLNIKRRQEAEKKAPLPTTDVVVGEQKSFDLKPKASPVSNPSSTSIISPAKPEPKETTPPPPAPPPDIIPSDKKVTSPNVDTFVPDQNSIDFFLNEASPTEEKQTAITNPDDSDDDEGGNPLVASVKEDIDLEEFLEGDSKPNTEYEEI